LEAAGCEPSHRCLGRSLWEVIRNPEAKLRDYQLSEIDNGERHIMIRSLQYKYAIDEQARGFMLYDLQDDPEEQNNLIAGGTTASPEIELREVLLKRIVEAQYSML
jgi:hypothetical protein